MIIAILSIASLLVIYSSTASMAYRKAGGDTAHYFLQQLKFIVLGFAAMIAVHRIDYQRYARPRLSVVRFRYGAVVHAVDLLRRSQSE